MTNTSKTLALVLGIALSTATVAQTSAEKPLDLPKEKSTKVLIDEEAEAIKTLTAEMLTAEGKQRAKYQKEISQHQQNLVDLMERAEIESRKTPANSANRQIAAVEVDVEKSTLSLKKFSARYDKGLDQIKVSFKTKEQGAGNLVLLTPGKEVVSMTAANADGNHEYAIDLNGQNIGIYFLHVNIDGKMTTEKIDLR